GKTYWNSIEHRYLERFLRPENGIFEGTLQLRLASPELASARCTWQVTGSAGDFTTSEKCGKYTDAQILVALNTPSATLTRPTKVSVSTDSGQTADIEIHPRHYIVLGLGDSYSSGEGNPDKPATWRNVVAPKHWTQL